MSADTGVTALAGFARALRDQGVAVPQGSTQLFAEALVALGAERPQSLYWAARLSLLRRSMDLETFERVFQTYWTARRPPLLAQTEQLPPRRLQLVPVGRIAAGDNGPERDQTALPVSLASSLARLREIDFSEYTEQEQRLAARLVERLRIALPVRRSRRTRPAARGRRVDLRRTLRLSLRTAGDAVQLVYGKRREKQRPLVLLCDVSGSMSAYSRALVQFLRAAVESRARTRVFAFGTRLVELTQPLAKSTRDDALRAATRHFDDWGGGTRIGASLRTFVCEYAQRGVTRGGVVVILSDGWEREDPRLVAEQMCRLRLLSHRIIWVNPNKRDPRFEPLAAGMASALPHVDALVSGHNLRALEELMALVQRLGDQESRR